LWTTSSAAFLDNKQLAQFDEEWTIKFDFKYRSIAIIVALQDGAATHL
jgi:hypothetical protein